LSGGGTAAWCALTDAYLPAGRVVQVVNVQTGVSANGITAIPFDNVAPPQNNEGDQYMTLPITPKSATNKLKIEVVAFLSHSADNMVMIGALFQDTTAGALAAGVQHLANGNNKMVCVSFTHYMTAGTTETTTFKVRCGANTGSTTYFNSIVGSDELAGVLASSITITEIKV
jgi:hypothetical protein